MTKSSKEPTNRYLTVHLTDIYLESYVDMIPVILKYLVLLKLLQYKNTPYPYDSITVAITSRPRPKVSFMEIYFLSLSQELLSLHMFL